MVVLEKEMNPKLTIAQKYLFSNNLVLTGYSVTHVLNAVVME